MTRVLARYGRGGYRIRCEGHATTPEACAAVSALLQALAGWLANTDLPGGVSLGPGRALIAFPDGPGAAAAMDLTVIGLLQIAKAAPDAVSVEVAYEEGDG